MTEPELRLVLSLALAEVERLRARTAVPIVETGPRDELLAECAQSYVLLLSAASHIGKRAPLVADQLRQRALRLQRAMRRSA